MTDVTRTTWTPSSFGVNVVLYSPSRIPFHSSGSSAVEPDGATTVAETDAPFTLANILSETSALIWNDSFGPTSSASVLAVTRPGTSFTSARMICRQNDLYVSSSAANCVRQSQESCTGKAYDRP